MLWFCDVLWRWWWQLTTAVFPLLCHFVLLRCVNVVPLSLICWLQKTVLPQQFFSFCCFIGAIHIFLSIACSSAACLKSNFVTVYHFVVKVLILCLCVCYLFDKITINIFSKPKCCRPSICRLSSVCLSVIGNARAPYSVGCNFPQYFYGIWYVCHPFTYTKNFTVIVLWNSSFWGVKGNRDSQV